MPRSVEIEVGKGLSIGFDVLNQNKLTTWILVKHTKGTAMIKGDVMMVENFKAQLLSLNE